MWAIYKFVVLTGLLLSIIPEEIKSNPDSIIVLGNKYGICVSAIPQHTMVRTVTAEIDKQVFKTPHWVVLSFSYSYRDDDIWDLHDFEFTLWRHYTLGASYRYYFFGKSAPRLLYSQSGFKYTHHIVEFSGLEVWPTTYNDAPAFVMEPGTYTDNLHQVAAELKVGVLQKVNSTFFFDFYMGVSYKQLINNENIFNQNYNKEAYMSPNYRGFTPLAGVRIGVNF